jgi:endonuclease/exonuclease/phosphatase (EEP) superfamily protein YafD
LASVSAGGSGLRGRAGSIRRSIFRSRWDALAVVPAVLVVAAAAVAILPPRSGPLAMAMVFEPHIFIGVAAVVAVAALLGRSRLLALSLIVTLVGGGFLFGSEWISVPGSAAGRHDLSVMSWNVQYRTRTPAEQASQLEGVTADLIDLQEVEPDAAAAIESDAVLTARYPYRAMAPRRGAWGLAILSRYPISNIRSTYPPACLDLIVATPRGPVHVVEAHPNHATIQTSTPLRLPLGYDPTTRDVEISSVRSRIEAALAAGDRLLVLGDYNTTPSEPEYSVLAAGLRDTHVEVGQGPGWTWRPSRLTFLPFGFLRIDLQLSAGAIRPVSTSIDCSLPGDHCRLFGDYEID